MNEGLCKGITNAGKKCPNIVNVGKEYCCKAHAKSRGAKWGGKTKKKKKRGKPKLKRCLGVTKQGVQCKIRKVSSNGFCKHHQGQILVGVKTFHNVDAVELDIGQKLIDPENVEPVADILYGEYLRTKHWERVKKRIKYIFQNKCQLCCSEVNLHVHHNDYRNMWHETIADVVLLCEKCHNLFHKYLWKPKT